MNDVKKGGTQIRNFPLLIKLLLIIYKRTDHSVDNSATLNWAQEGTLQPDQDPLAKLAKVESGRIVRSYIFYLYKVNH